MVIHYHMLKDIICMYSTCTRKLECYFTYKYNNNILVQTYHLAECGQAMTSLRACSSSSSDPTQTTVTPHKSLRTCIISQELSTVGSPTDMYAVFLRYPTSVCDIRSYRKATPADILI